MPLLLAIEPDSRQADLVADLTRPVPASELVLASTAAEGLKALKGRVPDLILTSTLLSPSDDGILTDHLRRLDDAGAHVQTLVIPVLADGQAEAQPSAGLLGRLGWRKPKASSPDGCDPSVFREQIVEYLNRANTLRRAFAHLPASTLDAPPSPAERPSASSFIIGDRQDAERPSAEPDWLRPASEEPAFTRSFEPEPFAPEPIAPEQIAPPPIALEPVVPEPQTDILLTEEALIVEHDFAPQIEPLVTEPAFDAAHTTSFETVEPVVEVDFASAMLDTVPSADPSIDEVELPAEEYTVADEESEEPFVGAFGAEEPTAEESADSMEVPPLEIPTYRPDILELLAAIQLDLEPLRSTAEQGADAPKPADVQDEWGFFDPQQCGMAALLTRLDQMAAQRESASARD